ncbi:hypothetical protein DNTS_009391 [Danionella cerebrum]|uniref:LIM domain 7a n=1 Tax=Danionella cerebrum TaxID=2873325 RepID=A0A553PX85_9TELE|nr:hypothetical protein DNTS_009391 [Danionella translucida]
MLLCWDAVVTRSLTEQLSFPWTSYLPTYWLLVLPVFVLVLQAVTKKTFGSRNFRSSLENGLLLCDLINKNKPGCIKKLNRFSSPIAGLDNLNLFLKTCGKLGLKEAQLFHPGDLQDLSTRVTVKHQESSRRLKNVLITIYWLGRKAHTDPFYNGPHLNLKAFEGLLGTTLYKALEDSRGSLWGSVLKGSSRESWDSEKEQLFPLQAGHRRQDSLDSLDSLGSRKHSTSSDTTLKENSDGCGSDPEADLSFTMSENKEYRRSLVVTPKTSTQFNQFLPSKDRQSGYVPAPLRKKRTERNEDNRRSWASPMFTEDDGTFTRSKSVSDIIEGEMNVTNSSMELRFEELQKMRTRLKENEEKWQDDLTKWKNKRRSVNSDIVKKKEDREQVEQISSGNTRKSKTFKEMQEERESRGQSSLRDSLSSIVDDVFEPPVPVPRTRTLPPRSYTVDTPYSHSIKPSMIEKEPITGTLATDEADSPTKPDRLSPEFPANNSIHESPTLTQSPLDDPVPALSNSTCSVLKPTSILKPNFVESTSETKQTESSSGPISSLYKPNSMDTKSSSLDQVSASLPKSYQRSDQITRLPSVVTPRPFGPQSNRIASLPRAFTVEDSVQRTNGEAESKENKKTPVPNRYAQNVTDDDRSLESSALNREAEKPPSPVPPVSRVSPLPKSSSHSSEMGFSEMRISLNQKPNSSQDFGFQHSWDSTGVWVKSVLPGSPAELCQMQAADEILAVNGHRVADMSYSEWKSSMEEALQQGSLLIDIRRHGKNNSGRDLPSLPYKSHKTINLTSLDPLGSSEPFLRSSLDFTSQQTKETVLKTVNVSSQPLNNYGSNGINGGIREDSVSMESKESVSVKNLKRRSEFFEQGNRTASGQCWCVMFGGTWVNKSSSFSPSSQALHKCALPLGSAGLTVSSLLYLCGKEEMTVFTGGSDASITAVAVPPITPSNTRWSWDPEEERRRQEKWQKEQERLLQGLDKHNLFSPLSSVQLPPASWEEQEKRKREGEILRLEEERRKQKEIDLFEEKRKREEEERKRREEERRLLEEEMKKREERERLEEQRRKKEEEERLLQEKERNRKEEEERKRLAEQKRWQQQDAGDSFGYTNVYPELSYSHRSISKSTPELDEVSKTDIKGVYSRHRGLAGWLLEDELRRKRNTESQKKQAASELELERRSILNAMKYRNPERASSGLGDVSKDYKKESQAALDRQQILQEMKKKTSLNTDNSWIRQQSTAGLTAKEPIDLPMRRGESLDNLDIPRSSWRSSWSTSSSTSTIPDYSRPHSALSGSSSYYSGRPGSVSLLASQSMSSLKQPTAPSLNAPEPQPRAPPRNRSVSGRKICSFCNSPLGKGAAMIIESLGLCYHLNCFKCSDCTSDLGGSEAGAEVRIRNQKLYCNSCYLGSPQPCDLTVLQQIEEEPITDKNL